MEYVDNCLIKNEAVLHSENLWAIKEWPGGPLFYMLGGKPKKIILVKCWNKWNLDKLTDSRSP